LRGQQSQIGSLSNFGQSSLQMAAVNGLVKGKM
jgi:hypothetical protein